MFAREVGMDLKAVALMLFEPSKHFGSLMMLCNIIEKGCSFCAVLTSSVLMQVGRNDVIQILAKESTDPKPGNKLSKEEKVVSR